MVGHPSVAFEDYFKKQTAAVQKCCLLLGSAEEQDKRDLLDACDVLVLPSRAYAYGIVTLEAWLAGKPAIGAYAGGIPYVISDGEDGFLVPFGDEHMLGEYILTILKNPELGRRMGQKGRKKVLEGCTWDHRYAKKRVWYESLQKNG